jgi:hypothetical protein
MLKVFAIFRLLSRLLVYFVKELQAGNPYAIGVAVMGMIGGLTYALSWFARRPLGGDPEKLALSDDAFQDDANPYRALD